MQNTLGELGSFIKGAPLSKADITDDGTPFILYGELYTTYEEVVNEIVRKTTRNAAQEHISRVGDVIVPTSGETPEEIATASCIMVPGVILAGDLNIYRTRAVDGRFVSYAIRHIINRKIASVAQGKSVVHIKAEELTKININYPCREEQNKILHFLSLLQSHINRQRKLIDTLKSYKRGVAHHIFTLLADTAQQGLLKDYAHISTGCSNTQDAAEDGIYPFFIRSQNVAKSNRYVFEGEAVLTIGDGQIGKVFHYINGRFDCHQRVYMITNFSAELDGKYFYHFFSGCFLERALRMSAKNTVDSVRMEMISDMPILIPSIEIQKRIAVLLDSIDAYIINTGEQHRELLQLKRALLQQLFI